jgi:hypothetical protein
MPSGKPPKRLHPNRTQTPKAPTYKLLRNMAGTTRLGFATSAQRRHKPTISPTLRLLLFLRRSQAAHFPEDDFWPASPAARWAITSRERVRLISFAPRKASGPRRAGRAVTRSLSHSHQLPSDSSLRLSCVEFAEHFHQVSDLGIFERTYGFFDLLARFLGGMAGRQLIELRIYFLPAEWSNRIPREV